MPTQPNVEPRSLTWLSRRFAPIYGSTPCDYQLPRCLVSARIRQDVRWDGRRHQPVCEDQRHMERAIQSKRLSATCDPLDDLGSQSLQKRGDVGKPFETEPDMHAAVDAEIKKQLLIGQGPEARPADRDLLG